MNAKNSQKKSKINLLGSFFNNFDNFKIFAKELIVAFVQCIWAIYAIIYNIYCSILCILYYITICILTVVPSANGVLFITDISQLSIPIGIYIQGLRIKISSNCAIHLFFIFLRTCLKLVIKITVIVIVINQLVINFRVSNKNNVKNFREHMPRSID